MSGRGDDRIEVPDPRSPRERRLQENPPLLSWLATTIMPKLISDDDLLELRDALCKAYGPGYSDDAKHLMRYLEVRCETMQKIVPSDAIGLSRVIKEIAQVHPEWVDRPPLSELETVRREARQAALAEVLLLVKHKKMEAAPDSVWQELRDVERHLHRLIEDVNG